MDTGEIQLPSGDGPGDWEFVAHVGPMKTATTFIQHILMSNRKRLREEGWEYPGERSNQQHAFYSLCGNDIPWVTERVEKRYQWLASDLTNSLKMHGRTIVSSEALACLTEKGIERLFKKIPAPTRVVFTLRPLQATLTSGWQQFLKRGETSTLETFISGVIDGLNIGKNDELPRTYLYGNAVKRWYDVLGCPIHLAEIEAGKSNADATWQCFRKASGLPEVDFCDVPQNALNTSLSLNAAELLRRFNKLFYETKILSLEQQARFVEECLLKEPRLKLGNENITLPSEVFQLVKSIEMQQRDIARYYADSE